MKKRILIITFVFLIIIVGVIIKLNSEMETVAKAFHLEHSLKGNNIILITDSISPNGKFKYYEYQFDNGGFGKSRVFWSVIKNNDNKNDLNIGLIPDGFKITGWNINNELILKKWNPSYKTNQLTELKSGIKMNGVKITLAE